MEISKKAKYAAKMINYEKYKLLEQLTNKCNI